ncbi:DUF6887 family protein [Geminocystis herdmanii]|uniref:DUF6887 family protein n=1 Tax=Geminocystis herdmanii TaxID=669359 RepID=UPI0003488877|nr:hypothetical protein [Geminocystis herdmanii]
MTKKLEMMTDKELRQYLSNHRDNEKAFSEALEILMNRKKNPFSYPPVSSMNEKELENIFKAKIQSI